MAEPEQSALISVYDKTDIEKFAGALVEQNWNIYASGGTAQRIQENGIQVIDVAELVGGSAILGHRVVTLSREIHAALLAQRTPEDLAELERLGIPFIDLVAVDMYPLQEAIADPSNTELDVIEKTDIGGPTMLRSAAKGRRIVLSQVEQRAQVLEWLKAGRPAEEEFRRHLAAIAEKEVAAYVLKSARYTGGTAVYGFIGERVATPKYGENPWQQNAGLYAENDGDPLALTNFEQLEGDDPSYNNYADLDRGLQTITHIAAALERNLGYVPMIAIGLKHGNACGAAIGETTLSAVLKAIQGDEQAIFGGSVMTNFSLGYKEAQLIKSNFEVGGLDVVAASGADDQALELLGRKGGKCRVLVNTALENLGIRSLDKETRSRYVRGGILMQDNYTYVPDLRKEAEIQTGSWVDDNQLRDLALAWAVGSTSNSNTITLVRNRMLIGNGVGQQDRVGAAELAIKRAIDAGHKVEGSVTYSDSYFAFSDAIKKLVEAGVLVILASSGSVRDKKVVEELKTLKESKKLNIQSFLTLPDKDARGFYAH